MKSQFWCGYVGGLAFMLGFIFSSFYITKQWDTRKSFEGEAVLNGVAEYKIMDGKKMFSWRKCQ